MAVVGDGDRLIRGEGVCQEEDWQRWLAETAPPPLDFDAWLSPGQRLVIVAPHPDDEVIACGGLIARHVDRHGSLLIVAVTDGEASHIGDARWPAARLADARRDERLAGLARLGAAAASVCSLQLGDGTVDAQRARLRAGLEVSLRPGDRVVATWSRDGHPDHDASGAETKKACAAIGCDYLEAPVWMWHWSWPDDPRVPWSRLRALRLSGDELQRKTSALQAHETQLAPRWGEPPVLGEAIRARAGRAAEYFFC